MSKSDQIAFSEVKKQMTAIVELLKPIRDKSLEDVVKKNKFDEYILSEEEKKNMTVRQVMQHFDGKYDQIKVQIRENEIETEMKNEVFSHIK